MAISFLLNAVSLTHEVSLEELMINPVDLTCNYAHGGDTGLTNTSLLVEYRIVDTTSSTSSVGEWRYLADKSTPVNIVGVQLPDSAAAGFQIRVLQLEHGGGMCNCWRLNTISVNCGGDMVNTTDMYMCGHQGFVNSEKMFCNDYASRARGMITGVYCSVSSNSCPGDSDTLLPSGGPVLPSHCETSDFRM